MVVKGNPVSLHTEVLFASNSFINGTINLSFNRVFFATISHSLCWAVSGEVLSVTGMLNLACHTDMLGTGWNVSARSCRSCKWSCVHITNRWSTLELRARHQIKLNLLCWAHSLSVSSGVGQAQHKNGKKAVVTSWGGVALGAYGARCVGGKRPGEVRRQQKWDTGLKRASMNRAESRGSHNCRCCSERFGKLQSINLSHQLLSPSEPSQG